MIRKIGFVFTCVFAIAIAVCANDAPPLSENTISAPQLGNTPIQNFAMQGPADPISLNFTNIKVRELLQIIAQFTQLNFVIDDGVSGEMSIHLHQVPWTQALDVILKSQDLGQRRVGNIVYIAPVNDLIKQQIAEMEANQRMQDLVPLEDRVVHLNYADAESIQKILDTKNYSLLSARGSTNVDKRTNSVWIRDTPAHVHTIVRLIRQLDFPVKQVMIEARIVNVSQKFERQLGAQFGLSSPSHLSGTLAGANQLAQGVNVADVTPLSDRLNFAIPASGTLFGSTNQAGSIGLALAKLGSTYIDMELSALEEQNDLNNKGSW